MKSNEKIIVRGFPGASTDDMSFHAVPSVKREPRCFVLHTGANDFRDEEDNKEIAKTIFGLAKTLKADENTVYVSGIIKRDDDKMNARISNVNKALKELCGEADFPFIDNSNIEVDHHLNRSGLHLNHFGHAKLAFNIISALRNWYFNRRSKEQKQTCADDEVDNEVNISHEFLHDSRDDLRGEVDAKSLLKKMRLTSKNNLIIAHQ